MQFVRSKGIFSQLSTRWRAWWRASLLGWQKRNTLGRRGEAAAERYLKRLGYKVLARGSRSPIGELDLIAVQGRTIVFIEVKTRHSHRAGHPLEAVDRAKQARLTRLALSYLKRHGLLDHSARFDVVAVTWPTKSRRPVVEHFPNAFDAVGQGQMFS